MSAEHFYDLNLTLVDTRAAVSLVLESGVLPDTEQGRFFAAMFERLAPRIKQSLKDIHQPAVRHALIDAPEELPS